MGNPPLRPKPLPPILGKQSLASQTAELRAMRKAAQQSIIAQGGTPATPLVQSFDPFDVVLGHLIDEGYADTEESALQIMANMSNEWRESIVEATPVPPANAEKVVTNADKLANNAAWKRLQAKTPGYVAAPHLQGV
jgi:hypothetical protein